MSAYLTPLETALAERAFHALGVESSKPWPGRPGWRNYYCQPVGERDEHLEALRAAGLAVTGRLINEGSDQYWHITSTGISDARALHVRLRRALGFRTWLCYVDGQFAGSATATTRSKARYLHWLDLRDVRPDIRLIDIRVGRLA